MTLFQIVALYVAINLILLVILTIRVGQKRVSGKVSLGDGGDAGLLARVRTHGNFTENAPYALIGLFALAMLSASSVMLHVFGVAFTLGRIAHAHGMAQAGANGKGRMIGALLSMLTFLGMAGCLLYKIFAG